MVAVCPPLIIDEDQVDELIAKLSIGLDVTLDWAQEIWVDELRQAAKG